MKKIIIPTDFSDDALNAIYYAVECYKNESCIFYFLHTYTPIIYSYDYQMNVSGYFSELADTMKETSIQQLEETKHKVIEKYKNPKHQFETIASFNLLVDELKEICKEKSIDLIIMGTKGATGAKEILFGSNTIHVIQKVKCPVLAIPNGYQFNIPKDLLFPTDYKIAYSSKHVDILIDIANLYHAKIHVFHVSHGVELNAIEKSNKERLDALLKNTKHIFQSSSDKDIPTAIHDFQKSTPIQLLMMINNKHSFFENLFFKPVIHQIGFHLEVPFLVVPSQISID